MTMYLTDYAHFTNKQDMDEAATQHRNANWSDMNDTERAVLDVIRRYSVKFGAAHLKHDTVAKCIGKSNATARRAIRKLAQLGIIERIHYIRPVMSGLGANIYAIKPYHDQSKVNTPEEATKPSSTKAQRENSKTEPLLYKYIPKDLKTTYPTEQISTTLYSRIKSLLTATIGEDVYARRFFGVYRQQSIPLLKFSIHANKADLFEQLAIQALHIAVQSTKKKKIRNLPGYYAGILRELIDKALFGDAFKDYDAPVSEFYYTNAQ